MTTRTVVDVIVAAAARAVAPFRLDGTPDLGVVQAHRSHVAVIPAMGDLMPRPTGDRAPDVAVPDGEAGTATPTVPEAGVVACGCGRPVLSASTDVHGLRRVVLDATPAAEGTYELIHPGRAGARVMQVGPAVSIRPTYTVHRCRQAVAA